MKFGVRFEGMNAAALIAAAQKAEELGFESLWRPDHLILPTEVSATYPYSADGRAPLAPDWPVLDPLTVFAFTAAVTSTIKMGTNVYILPLRHPVVTARSVLGIDRLSRGRMILGVGAGWLEEEFVAAGQEYHTRGARTDECIELMKALWTEKVINYQGKHYQCGPVMFEPKPFAQPHPPIIVGGESEAALRRAARLGDGWFGVRHEPQAMAGFVRRLRELRAEYGREDAPFEISVNSRPNLTPDDVHAFEEAGVDRLVVGLWDTSRQAIPGLERFADEVLAKV